jgi:hypothetical protein
MNTPQVATGPAVLVLAYNASVGIAAIKKCPAGQLNRLWIVINPNNGPGLVPDLSYVKLVKLALSAGAKLFCYIDAVNWINDKPRKKKAAAIRAEAHRYIALYELRPTQFGFFIDDVSADNAALFQELSLWTCPLILNAGTKLAKNKNFNLLQRPPFVVISEDSKGWPRKLAPHEAASKLMCGVIGLAIKDIIEFVSSTQELGFRTAYPDDDNWKAGLSPYGALSKHFLSLF